MFLFDDTAVQLFGQTHFKPSPIRATVENQQRLSQWLQVAFRGGGTDPRDALHTALRMKPSAIFLLSDGAFNNQPRTARFIQGNSDVFSIVATSTGTPIHTIAFEDTRNCANMQRLAQMSGGTYRFVGRPEDGVAAAQALAGARELLNRGDKLAAEQSLGQIIADFGPTEAAAQARNQLASLLLNRAHEATRKEQYDLAKAAFLQIANMDPDALATDKIQQEMITGLWHRSLQEPESLDVAAAKSVLSEIFASLPESKSGRQIMKNWTRFRLANAQRLHANENDPQAIRELKQCRQQHQQITHALVAVTNEVRWREDVIEYARHLRDTADTFQGSRVEAAARQDLEHLANELLVLARDAFGRHDRSTGKNIYQLLREVAGEKASEKLRRNFYQRERTARKKLAWASRRETDGAIKKAIQAYEKIIADYSQTLAADGARARLQELQGETFFDVEMAGHAAVFEIQAGRSPPTQ